MQLSLILTSLFGFTMWMNLVQATIGLGNTCPCVVLSMTRVPHSKIKGYTIQKEGVCMFKAIVFHTMAEKTICSNPNDGWAKYVIQQLEKRQKEKTTISAPGSKQAATGSITPAQESEPNSTPTLAPSTQGSEPPSTPTSEPPSTPAAAPRSAQISTATSAPSTPAMAQGSEPLSTPTAAATLSTPTRTPTTPAIALGSEPLLTPTSSPASLPISEPTLPPSTKTSTSLTTPSVPQSEPLSTPTSVQSTPAKASPTSLQGSELTLGPTLSPSTKTSASLTPNSAPSAKTLTPVSTKSTPNPTSASTPNNFAGAPSTGSAYDCILGASMTTRKGSTQRGLTTKK